MKNVNEYKIQSDENEISSLIYSILATADNIENKQGNLDKYNPIVFLVKYLYNENLPIFNHLEFITRKGGARYVMNNVTAYRKIKNYKVKKIKSLKYLFKKFNCKNKEDIIKFITYIYNHRNDEILPKNQVIKKIIMAYQIYYKNDISLSTWPSDKTIYSDYLTYKVNTNIKDDSYIDYSIGLGLNENNSSKVISKKHIRYPDTKMIIIADGNGYIENENAAYTFCDKMNEWFWKCNPYQENFELELETVIKLINWQIGENNIKNNNYSETSASIIIITKDKYYISSIGNTRVYLVKDGKLTKIPHKESLYDELKEKKLIMPFTKEYAQSIPYDTIGHPIDEIDKCNPETTTILSSFVDGLIAISYGVYNNTTKEEIENIIKNCVVEDTAQIISAKAEFGIIKDPKYQKLFNPSKLSGSNVVAIYKKNKKKWVKSKILTLK